MYDRTGGDATSAGAGETSSLRNPGILSLIRNRIEKLRIRLLDSSRRNPLIQVPFRSNSSTILRFVDELPNELAGRLADRQRMRLVPLPALDEPLADEQTANFLEALDLARITNTEYRDASRALDDSDPEYAQKELDIERTLKDRVRAALDLPERQTKENLSLADHARVHGISPEFILPRPDDRHDDGRHDDRDIQTMLLPDRLSRVGRTLHDRGHAFERETGVNVLHTAFGILEWNNPGNPQSPAISPLIMLEVKMERRKAPSGTEYYICGESDLAINTTLAQTLLTQFGLELPKLEGNDIEAYFVEIAEIAPRGWHWKIRREAFFGVFPSNRIAMYHDLDPEKRPIAEHPIIASLLATSSGDASGYAEVYDTDEPEIERCVPHLVMDADSSQFSSLVDASRGQNVAIEGPPGSGKSQTIVNLIASAIADGKKVLFVAEKLTALDVVRNRLEAASLGEFVLPLQAGRGSREEVFKSLNERLEMGKSTGRAGETHEARKDALHQRRAQLQDYLSVLGTKVARSGLTVHETIGRAIATAEHLIGLPREIQKLRIPNAQDLDTEQREALMGDARMTVDRLEAADGIAPFWKTARSAPVRVDEAETIAIELTDLLDALDVLRNESRAGDTPRFIGTDIVGADSEAILAALRAICEAVDIDAKMAQALLGAPARAEALTACDAMDALAAGLKALQLLTPDPDADDVGERISEAERFAAEHDRMVDPADLRERLERQEITLEKLKAQRTLAINLPAGWAEQSEAPLADVQIDAEMLLRVPEAILRRRQPDHGRLVPGAAREAIATHGKLSAELGSLRNQLPGAGPHPVRHISEAKDTIASSGFFRFLSSRYKRARIFVQEELGAGKVERHIACSMLSEYVEWAGKRTAFKDDVRMSNTLGDLFDGLESDVALLDGLATFHETVFRISAGEDRLQYALETGSLDAIRAFAHGEKMPSRSAAELRRDISANERDISILKEDIARAQRICAYFRGSSTLDGETIARASNAYKDMTTARRILEAAPAADFVAKAPNTDAVRRAAVFAETVSHLPEPEAGIALLGAAGANALRETCQDLFERRETLARKARTYASELQLANIDPSDALAGLSADAGAIREAARRPEGLSEQALLLRSISTMEGHGLGDLINWVLDRETAERRGRLTDIVGALLARSLSDFAHNLHRMTLEAHDGRDLARLRLEIADIDKGLIKLSRAAIKDFLLGTANPPEGNGTGKVSTFTQMALISHELGKSRRHIGVRELTARAGHALLELKPCWMMSPLAVSQYLQEGMTFDLVVVDEASQMTPENALGAVMRANQVVIVGDTKQLPPTNFFQKVLDDDGDDEDGDDRTDSESILDMANTTFRPKRQLRWHYRSRHPHLIAVSNKMVYDEKLTIFPAARDNDPSLGVQLVEVEGHYKSSINVAEAQAIVAGAIAHMRDHPHRSLGLATMNRKQTDLIVEEFERERERHPHVEAYIERWAEKDDGLEEFFVKNLETIQGDERDVIMISTLYGPDPDSKKVHQRFGPVNGQYGHRRLNVLFSRAKERIITYSSMKPTDIQPDGKAYGVKMLRAWLEFSKSKMISDIDGARAETDSPFEDYVIAQIEAAGFEAVPQVGASGFRIDIGVRHKDWPYGYILAVECDGAAYHSSRSSRERDRLRQEVLEGLGWHFYRIWSTDWFRDPRTQIEKLRLVLQKALERAKRDEEKEQKLIAQAAEVARLETEEAARRASEAALSLEGIQGDLFGGG